jgi:hypothetical protein
MYSTEDFLQVAIKIAALGLFQQRSLYALRCADYELKRGV